MNRYVCIALALLLSGFSQPQDDSRFDSECSAMLKDCFALSDSARDLCFQKSSQEEECVGTPEGSLVAKRAAFSSANTTERDDAFPTPGASIINRKCVKNFDSLWLSNVVNDSLSQETIANLSALLDGCASSSPNEMMRP